MNTLLTGITTYITSWRSALALVALAIAAYMWMRGHHFAAAMEVLAALAIIFTVSSLAPQLGF